ncbi:MAG TPA: c-type cytochrome, partial [Nannocystis exedens]|nr:c-type cytochrome [Nannocystis exedens]
MQWATISGVFGLCVALGLGACDDDPPKTTPSKQSPAPVDDPPGFIDDPAELHVDPTIAAKAKILWETSCAKCHGPYGDGKGPAGEKLDPPPRNFHRRTWQANTADEHIKRVILQGGPATGLSPAMVAHIELQSQPELLDQVVLLLRGFPHWKPAPAGSLDAHGEPLPTVPAPTPPETVPPATAPATSP